MCARLVDESRRWSAVAVVAMVAWVVLDVAEVATAFDYDACRASVGSRALDKGLLESLTRDLLPAAKLDAREWNFNGAHDASAVNLIFPDRAAKASWDADACDGSASLPRCWSIPRSNTIVCNPGFAEWLARANYFGPPIRVEVALAGRFLVQSILGHEIGHLERGGEGGRRHMAKDADALRCAPLPVLGGSEEMACDERGAALACHAAKGSETWRLIVDAHEGGLSWDYAYSLIGRVRGEIRDFEPADDACTGREGYESFSLRRRKLSVNLLDCLMNRATNPFADSLDAEIHDFQRTEDALRERQTFAVWADPEGQFEEAPSVTGVGPDTFVLSGWIEHKGRLKLIRRAGNDIQSFLVKGAFPGRVRAARRVEPNRWELVFRQTVDEAGHLPSQLSRSYLSCPEDRGLEACWVSRPERGAKTTEGAVVQYGIDGSVLIADPDRLQIFASAADSRPAVVHQPAFSTSEVHVAAIRDRRLAVSSQFVDKGLFVLEITTPERQTFKMLPLDSSCTIRSLGFDRDRLRILTSCDHLDGTVDEVIDCPSAGLLESGLDLDLGRCSTHTFEPPSPPPLALFGESPTHAPDLERAPFGCDGAAFLSQGGWTRVEPSNRPAITLPVEQVIACDWSQRQLVGYREGKLNWLSLPHELVSARSPEKLAADHD